MSEIRYDKHIFAENLRRLMEQQGSRQADLARLLGVSRSTLSAYCSGEQMPRMDKLEALAQHFSVPVSRLIEEEKGKIVRLSPPAVEESHPALRVYRRLNARGQAEFLRYGRELSEKALYRAESPAIAETIKHYLVPAAAGYASPIEGEDYELLPRSAQVPAAADFCIRIQGDSMEPYIQDGQLVYVRRGVLDEGLRQLRGEGFQLPKGPQDYIGDWVFYVDGDVFCKQWCQDYAGTLHLLSANPARQDANVVIPRSSNRSCVCFGKVLLPQRLPRPVYY